MKHLMNVPVVLLGGLLVTSPALADGDDSNTVPLNQVLIGANISGLRVDPDTGALIANGVGLTTAEHRGSGGQGTLTGRSAGGPAEIVGFNTPRCPWKLEATIVPTSQVWTFKNVSVLTAAMVVEESFVCFTLDPFFANVVESEFTAAFEITGGLGHFDGAGGSYDLTLTCRPALEPATPPGVTDDNVLAHTGCIGEAIGEVVLP